MAERAFNNRCRWAWAGETDALAVGEKRLKILNVCPHCGKDNLRIDFYDGNTWVVISCIRERQVIGASLLSEIEFAPCNNESLGKTISIPNELRLNAAT